LVSAYKVSTSSRGAPARHLCPALATILMNKLTDICPDFPEWPKRWMGTEQDFEYGKQLLEAMRPFAESLAEGGLARKTIKKAFDQSLAPRRRDHPRCKPL
jgi:hypothetical protein